MNYLPLSSIHAFCWFQKNFLVSLNCINRTEKRKWKKKPDNFVGVVNNFIYCWVILDCTCHSFSSVPPSFTFLPFTVFPNVFVILCYPTLLPSSIINTAVVVAVVVAFKIVVSTVTTNHHDNTITIITQLTTRTSSPNSLIVFAVLI